MKRFQVLTGILDEDVCAQACQDFLLCSNYTFFGPSNPLKWVKLYRTEGCPTWKMGIHFSFLMTTKRREAWMKNIIFFSGSSVSSSPPATTSQLIAKTVMLESHSARWLLIKAGMSANPWLTLQSILYGEGGAFHKCQQSVNSQSYSSFEG